jgi:N4-gp56 family major capsid protein
MSGNMTNFARLTEEQKTAWSLDFWKRARNASFVEKFTGTGPNSMIQRVTELRKNEKGARAVLTLLSDMQGDGVAGDRQLEGNEEALLSHDRVIRMDQLRDANVQEGRMADQKSIVNFRFTSRDMLAYWMSDRIDQLAFLTLAGVTYARGTNGVLRPVSDLPNLEFAADVAPPSANRRLRWDSTAKALVANAATTDVTVDDKPSYAMLVELKAYARSRYMRGLRGDGGEELYHVFLSPQAMAKLKLDPDYIANLRGAGPRSASNQLFAGGVTTVDGLVIHDFRHVYNTAGLASGSKWGGDGTVDGCSVLFCGAQALGMADIGAPVWEEKEFDYGNRQGIAIGKIFGLLKPQFPNIYEGGSTEDFGVINCYVAQ